MLLTETVAVSDSGLAGVTFEGRVESAANGLHGLSVNASAGSVLFAGDIGGSTEELALGHFRVEVAAGGLLLGGPGGLSMVRTMGPIDLGAVSPIGGAGVRFRAAPGGPLSVMTGGASLRVHGPVRLDGDLHVREQRREHYLDGRVPH